MGCDLAVVGGGVLGLAHAIAAHERGLEVEVVERCQRAIGASIRNFGMIWPIGQPRGPLRELADRSAALWARRAEQLGMRCERTGSLHCAHADDEWQLLREYAERATADEALELWSPEQCAQQAPGTVLAGLRGGLFSPHERSVDPPAAIAALHAWLVAEGVAVHAPEVAVAAASGVVRTASGRVIEAERVAICSGSDFESLFPAVFDASWTKCKLQMLATGPQPASFALGPMRAAGLTLLHYGGFADCPAREAVRARLDAELPEHRRLGIHVLAAQFGSGEIALGDSHEYGRVFDPGLRADVERHVLDYLIRFLQLPEPAIARRWSGVYAVRRQPAEDFEYEVLPGVSVVNGPGGAGMTLSMGIGERHVQRWFA